MRRFAALLLASLLLLSGPSAAEPDTVRIGVLSHRGDEATHRMWRSTADYLTGSLPDFRFQILPLDFDEVLPAVERGEIDFVLTNPGIYVNLEVRYRVSRIATLNNRRGGVGYNIFGGVIFTRGDRFDLQTLDDLRGVRFAAVDERSLGGFQMAWGELARQGIDPYRDFSELRFAGTHDQVVRAVLAGDVDAGTVRTDILERMSLAGTIDLARIRVMHQKENSEFPFVHSTPLYPEWPFSKLQHTPNALAQRVAVALLEMPEEHPAALAGRYSGWTIPLDYQPVHELFKELHLPPYPERPVTLWEVIHYYGQYLLGGIGALLVMVFMSTWVWRLNRQLENAKTCLEQQHNLILNSVADGIYGVDLEGNSTFVNRAMEDITGWSAADLIGKNQHEFLHHTRADGSPHPPEECPVYVTARDNVPRYVEDDVFWRRDGSSFPVDYTSTPVHNERGEPVGAVVVFRDITERREAQERLRCHQMELAHVGRLSTMGEMASGIAHELNQPLAAVANYSRGCINMLRSGKWNSDQMIEVMDRMANQAERAGEIIRQLRAFVRKDQSERSVIDLNRRISDLAVLIGPDARREGVAFHLDLDSARARVQGHGIQIEQVVLNLARNAIEAMHGTPANERRLVISTRVQDNRVAVRVEDTGSGIDGELADKLFDPFVTTKREGMGLGLSISRGIIEAHGGTLSVSPASGQGSVFHFNLPLHSDR